MRRLILASWLVLVTGLASAGTLVSREDTSYIFSLNKHQWEAYATRVAHPPDWNLSLTPNDTGTAVIAFDPATGVGMSIQPLYADEENPPEVVIFGSYYPRGTLPEFTDDLQRQTEEQAEQDLGSPYRVAASYGSYPFGEGVELTVTKPTN